MERKEREDAAAKAKAGGAKGGAAKPGDDAKADEGSGIRLGKLGGPKLGGGGGGSSTAAPSAPGDLVDVEALRQAIQTLCQNTNPLSKCMDFVAEDTDAMKRELEQWRVEFVRKCDAMELAEKATEETLQPLLAQKMEVQERIEEKSRQISSVKASIAKNDQRIAELLRMVTQV